MVNGRMRSLGRHGTDHRRLEPSQEDRAIVGGAAVGAGTVTPSITSTVD
jgi:hypothetical protein